MVLLLPDLRMDELFGDGNRNAGRRRLADEMQHHIERRCTAGTGEYIPVHDVQIARHFERWILRPE